MEAVPPGEVWMDLLLLDGYFGLNGVSGPGFTSASICMCFVEFWSNSVVHSSINQIDLRSQEEAFITRNFNYAMIRHSFKY